MKQTGAVPKVSVIVLNYNGAHLLPECLRSLRQQDWPNLEVLIADNGSQDDSEQVTVEHGARFLPLGKNHGYSIGNNLGARAAAGDFLFFLNNDTRVGQGAIRRLAEVLISDEESFVADPAVMDWDGRRLIHHGLQLSRGSFFRSTFPHLNLVGVAGRQMETVWGCGSSLMVRRWMFQELAGFDETFLFDWEDADLCWRGWLRGWKSIYVPDAVIYHMVGETFEATHKQERVSLRAMDGTKNYLRFTLKVMPRDIVMKVLIRELCRIPRQALFGDPRLSVAQIRALLRTLRGLPDTLRLRRQIALATTLDSQSIVSRFLVAG